MTVLHRGPRSKDHFTMVTNSAVRDSRLSLKARGLLVLLLSHAEGYQISAQRLSEQTREGRDALRSAMRELEDIGYLRRVRRRAPDGTFATETTVYETPQGDLPDLQPGTNQQVTPETGYPTRVTRSGSPAAGHPEVAGPVVIEEQPQEDQVLEDQPPPAPPRGGARAPARTRDRPTDGERRPPQHPPRKRAVRPRPPDWQPIAAHREKHTRLRLLSSLEFLADQFRCHHDAKGTLFVDWDQAFHTWLNNESKYQAQDNTRHQKENRVMGLKRPDVRDANTEYWNNGGEFMGEWAARQEAMGDSTGGRSLW